MNKPSPESIAIAGDVTNDGKIDIVSCLSYRADPRWSICAVFERIGGTFINTFNVSMPLWNSCGDNSLKIADINNDGQNEMVFVCITNVDTPTQHSYFSIIRNGEQVFTGDTGYRSSYIVVCGDHDNDA